MNSTVVPLYTAHLTSSHPSYAATFSWHGQFPLFIYPSPTTTPLTRPAATFFGGPKVESYPHQRPLHVIFWEIRIKTKKIIWEAKACWFTFHKNMESRLQRGIYERGLTFWIFFRRFLDPCQRSNWWLMSENSFPKI